jgi:O-antigen/teichoic acid export membrane protein
LKEKSVTKTENLKKRAFLNSATSILDQGVKIIIGFVINPFVIGGLGSYLFGAWQVLNQFTNYTTLANIRVSEVLKWSVARDRKTLSDTELKENLTSALVLILLIIPVFLILGGVLVYFAPNITKVTPEYYDLVRITASILVLTVIVKSVFSLFESVLRGMNIGYKSMGIRAVIIILGGVLKIIALKLGYGLIGLASVQVLIVFLTGFIILMIVKKNVPWFGYGKFNKERTKNFVKLSGWFMAWMGVKTLLVGSDKVLLGYFLGPIVVTKYVVTKYIGQATQGIITNVIHGVLPGVGTLFGQKKFQKLVKVRADMILITWLLSGIIGFIILAFNSSFASLWVGADNYLNQESNLAILLMVVQYLFIQNDSVLINTMLDVKSKTILGLISVVLSVLLAYFFVESYGALGFVIGIILGRFLLSIAYPIIVKNKLTNTLIPQRPFQLIFTILVLWGLGYYAQSFININNWIILILSMFVAFVFSTLLFVFLGLKKIEREKFLQYAKSVKFNKKNKK